MNIDRSLLKSYDDSETPTAGAPPLPPQADTRRAVASDVNQLAARRSEAPRPAPERVRPIAPAPQPVPHHDAASERPQPPVQPQSHQPNTNVTINISMPKLKKPKLPENWPLERVKKWALIVVGLIVASFVLHALITFAIHKKRTYDAKHRVDMIQQQQRTSPTFKPLVPAANSAAVAKTAAYDTQRNSYSYSDTLKGTSVLISQQPLGTGDANAVVAKVAKSLNATTVVLMKGGTAYMSSDKTSGAQTLVFSKDNLLVFVQSSFAHSMQDWQSYLNSLAA